MSFIKNIYREYDQGFVIDIPELEIPDSGVTALLGPSGSGKSTLFRLLIGLEECPGMQWQFDGQDIAKLDVGKRGIGVVFQNYELFPHLTAKENIEFPLNDPKSKAASVEMLIEKLNLKSCLNTKANFLSGGERQRVALARAIINQPKILLLDEPFAALDVNVRQSARQVIKDLVTDLGIPVLMVTHDEKDVDMLAQSIVKIENGKITKG